MSTATTNNYPKLHNAAWPGVVGKGPDGEPPIDIDTMLDLTAAAEVDGVRFDGFDLFLYEPHINIDGSDDDIRRLADKARARGLDIGTVVAPIWPPTGGGSAMGDLAERKKFLGQVRKGCHFARRLRELGVRPNGVVRIDSACGVEPWLADPDGNQRRIAETFREACTIAEGEGERLAAEGEICWGGMHSWRRMLQLLEMVGRPQTLGFQDDMAHTLLYGRHCLANDPNGKQDIVRRAGAWLRDEKGQLTRKFRHICWDGCMFPNAVMMDPSTWNNILRAMLGVRAAHGWKE